MQMRQTLEIKVNDSTWIRFRDNELTIQKISHNYGWPMGNSSQLIELTIDEAQQIIDAVKMVKLTKTGYKLKEESNVQLKRDKTIRRRGNDNKSDRDESNNGKLSADHIRDAVKQLKESSRPQSENGINQKEIEKQNHPTEEESE